MKKFLCMLLIMFSIGLFAQEAPKTKETVIKNDIYTIKIEYIQEYKQAIFILTEKENYFDEGQAEVAIGKEIEKFYKENGYYGYKEIQYSYRIRYYGDEVKYTKPVYFLMSSK